MGLLQDKLAKYDLPQQYMAMGVYPYFRTIDSHQDTEVLMDGKKVLMFGSNAYTGLTYDKRIIEAAKAATDKYGTGCAGSRLLNGTLDIHVELEKELAEFVGKDDALCFSTGFTVNEGVIPQLTGRNDYIICDDRVHASIVDGRRLSFSTQLKYKHNDMADLEKELQKCEPDAIKLIVVDSVFSMEGDLANLPEIVRLKKKYNASIMVDEAHGLGVFGKQKTRKRRSATARCSWPRPRAGSAKRSSRSSTCRRGMTGGRSLRTSPTACCGRTASASSAATARANRRSCGCSRARFSPTAARSSWARRSASGIFRRRGASWT